MQPDDFGDSVARDALAHELGVDLLALTEEVRLASVAYNKRRANVEYLDDMRKVLLAELMENERERLDKTGEKVTESRLDNAARMSPSYKNFLAAQRDEKHHLAEDEARYYAKRNTLDAYHEMARYARAGMFLER